MKDKNPCVGCTQEFDRCHRICSLHLRYQQRKAEEREVIRAKQQQEAAYSNFKYERVMETKKRAGLD